MNNLEYLKNLEPINIGTIFNVQNDENRIDDVSKMQMEIRSLKLLEIIAEELCIMNNPKYEVTIVKPKIQLNKKALGYINKTSATKIKRI